MATYLDLHDDPPPDRKEGGTTIRTLFASPLLDLTQVPQSPRPSSSDFFSFLPRIPQLPGRRLPPIPAPEIQLPNLDSPPITSLPRSRIPIPRPGPRTPRRHRIPPLYKQVLRKEGWRIARMRQAEVKQREMASKREREEDDGHHAEESLRILERRVKLLKEKVQIEQPATTYEELGVPSTKEFDKEQCPTSDQVVKLGGLSAEVAQRPSVLHTYRQDAPQNAVNLDNTVDLSALPSTATVRGSSRELSLPDCRPRANSMVEQDLLDSAMDADDDHVSDEDDIDDTDTEVDFEDAYQSILLDEDEDSHHNDSHKTTHGDKPLFPTPPHIERALPDHTSRSTGENTNEILTNSSRTQHSVIDDGETDSDSSTDSTLAPSSSPPIVLSLANIVNSAKDRAHERQQTLIKKRGREAYEKHLADDEARKKRRMGIIQGEEINMEEIKAEQERLVSEQRSKRSFWTTVEAAGRWFKQQEDSGEEGLGISSD